MNWLTQLLNPENAVTGPRKRVPKERLSQVKSITSRDDDNPSKNLITAVMERPNDVRMKANGTEDNIDSEDEEWEGSHTNERSRKTKNNEN